MPAQSLQINLGHAAGDDPRKAWDCDVCTVYLHGKDQKTTTVIADRGTPRFMRAFDEPNPVELHRVIRALTLYALELKAELEDR